MKIYFLSGREVTERSRTSGSRLYPQAELCREFMRHTEMVQTNKKNPTVFISGFILSFFSGAPPVNSTPLGTYCRINPLKRRKSSGNKMPANSLGFCRPPPPSPRTSSRLCLLTSLAAAVQHIHSHRLQSTRWLWVSNFYFCFTCTHRTTSLHPGNRVFLVCPFCVTTRFVSDACLRDFISLATADKRQTEPQKCQFESFQHNFFTRIQIMNIHSHPTLSPRGTKWNFLPFSQLYIEVHCSEVTQLHCRFVAV